MKSYHGIESTGTVQISGIDCSKLRDKHVILIEDIIDTGLTMSKVIPMLREYCPKSVKVATLLQKRTPKSCGLQGDYVGFSIPDSFVVGYSLDYNEVFRDMRHICVINEAGIAQYADHEWAFLFCINKLDSVISTTKANKHGLLRNKNLVLAWY